MTLFYCKTSITREIQIAWRCLRDRLGILTLFCHPGECERFLSKGDHSTGVGENNLAIVIEMDWREETEAERQLRSYYDCRGKKLFVRPGVEQSKLTFLTD